MLNQYCQCYAKKGNQALYAGKSLELQNKEQLQKPASAKIASILAA
jgi:hypothetical protein